MKYRIVDSSQACYEPGRYVAQFYERNIGTWFDLGDPVDTMAEAQLKIRNHERGDR